KARQMALTPKTITISPEWKLESEDIISDLTRCRKRVGALESLKDSREIDGEIYSELLESQKAGYMDKVKTASALVSSMRSRLAELTGQITSLTKYLINAKLDHKSGELVEASLKLAQVMIYRSLRLLI